MSRPSKTLDKKNTIKIIDKEAERPHIRKTEESIIEEQDDKENASYANIVPADDPNKPINLGDQVFKVVAVTYLFN